MAERYFFVVEVQQALAALTAVNGQVDAHAVVNDPDHDVVSDLVANLMHLVRSEGGSPAESMQTAWSLFGADLLEESDVGGDEQARALLVDAQVPEAAQHDALCIAGFAAGQMPG